MQVTWNPEDGSAPQVWQFDPDDVPYKRAKEIERYYGNSWDQWVAQLQIGSMEARAVLLWYMLTEVHSKLKFEDVPDFRVRQLKVEMGVAELTKLWERVKRMKLKEQERDAFQAQFEADMRDALDREGLYDTQFSTESGRLEIEGPGDSPKEAA